MKYREEVENAIEANLDEFESGGNGSEELDAARFRALILLGVKLGLEAAAARAENLPVVGRAADEIRDIHPGHVLVSKP